MRTAQRNVALEHLGDEVYGFDLFTPRECRALLKAIDKLPRESPNTMNKYGRAIVGAEMRDLVATIVEKVVAPIALRVYPEIRPLKKRPYAFVVDYAWNTQRSLAKHCDTSDVTLNVSLNDEFTGGALMLYGRRGGHSCVKQVLGRAIIHRGSHGHRALPLLTGHRTNLILWCDAKGTVRA